MPHSYWHGWEACSAAALASGWPTYLYACVDQCTGARVAVPFSVRGSGADGDIYTPMGFSGFVSTGPVESARAQWLDFVTEQRYVCGYFALHPAVAEVGMHCNVHAVNDLYFLDLRAGAQAAIDSMHRDVRRVLRNFDKDGGRYLTDRELIADFIRHNYADFMHSVGANPAAMWSSCALDRMLEDENLLMVGAGDEVGVCAAYTFGWTGSGADAHLSLSVRQGRRYIAPLLAWGVRRLADRHVPWLNLGGGVVADDAVARAKHKFGPARMPMQAAREIYRPDRYADLCEGNQATAGGGVYFPAYRQPGVARLHD